ncbi:cation-translocating P-type ATPase [Burkholderia sp. LMU1-1-1.1]|uniref:cation-translocating P-type ATPase n=1 Tax=Burkholderia sp. LMU1-1-1.1 TaxID=3135266 RepID=UPI00341C514F
MRQQENNEGLTAAEAAARLAAHGFNELPASRRSGPWRLLGQALAEPMILLLAACGAVYMLLGDAGDALLLLAFVCIVVAMTFFQKRRTERSLNALRDYSSPRALVVRDGRQQRIAGRELVVGDLVLLAEGDRVPADMALSTSSNFTVDESMLTGESGPVTKQAAGDGDGAHRVYSGTLVTNGTARGTVTATAADSAIGRIGASLASLDSEPTPIQRETRAVVRQVAIGGLVLAAGLGLAYWWLRGDWVGGLLAGLTLAMAVLPEELPVVLTLFLGVGAWRLARQKVLARSAPAIELLGATTILCVDKTGTLTVNRMELARLWTEEGGDDNCAGGVPLPPAARALLENAVLASHRTAYDPMEAAIANAGARLLAGVPHGDWRLIDDYPLSPQLFAMSRVWQAPGEAACRVVAKGAPEAIVELCHLDPARAARVAARVAAMAGEGLRVLGVAVAAADAANLPQHQHGFDFAFAGLLALADPLRPEVPSVVAQCHAAGMRVVMITGDHPATAMAIARQAGIAGAGGACLTGDDLRRFDGRALREAIKDANVFCRIAPEQKLRLVRAFRDGGEVVAMTGDGVNDAPALKAADIGVAMGARGTDVAREAAALVLLEDDFSLLLKAVRHGRRLYANLRKALVFVVAVHVPIVGLSVLPLLWGGAMLLMPVHVLFLQIIIDPACSVVFEAEPIEQDAMRSGPRRPDARLFDWEILIRGLRQGGGLLALLVALYLWLRQTGGADDLARTTTFLALVLSNLGLIYANSSWRHAAWKRTGAPNRYLVWGSLGAAALLALVLGAPPLRALFAFAIPDPPALLAGALAVGLSLGWFEAVKWGFVAARP